MLKKKECIWYKHSNICSFKLYWQYLCRSWWSSGMMPEKVTWVQFPARISRGLPNCCYGKALFYSSFVYLSSLYKKQTFDFQYFCSQQTQDVNWTSYVRSVYVLCLGGILLHFNNANLFYREQWTIKGIEGTVNESRYN